MSGGSCACDEGQIVFSGCRQVIGGGCTGRVGPPSSSVCAAPAQSVVPAAQEDGLGRSPAGVS